GELCSTCSFSLESSFLVGRKLVPVSWRRTAISRMLVRVSLQRQDKLSYLRVPYQNQLLSRPCCSVGVGLPGFYGQGFSCRTFTAGIWVTSRRKSVLACRQVAIVISALGKASHVLAINRHDKAQIRSEVCDPIYDQM